MFGGTQVGNFGQHVELGANISQTHSSVIDHHGQKCYVIDPEISRVNYM